MPDDNNPPVVQTQVVQTFDYLMFGENLNQDPDLSFRKVFVQISKLLVERWLGDPDGMRFNLDLEDSSVPNPQERLRKALKNRGIPLADWVTPNPDTDTYNGSFTCDESKPGLAFLWNIPLQSPPSETLLSKEQLRAWIKICDDWLNDQSHQDPNAPFPTTTSLYIPLATS